MFYFLSGDSGVGKTTAIRKTIKLLDLRGPLVVGGFFTWKGDCGDPCVYMRPACSNESGEIYQVAAWNEAKGKMVGDCSAFDEVGASILARSKDADLIIMDELGYLESDALVFRNAVSDVLGGDVPVLGVLRLGSVPWLDAIKRNSRVVSIDVNKENRDALPRELVDRLLR